MATSVRRDLSTSSQVRDFNPDSISQRILNAFNRSDFAERHARLLNNLTPLQLDEV